jgi:ABC-type phosphate transport system substrate-binding protein
MADKAQPPVIFNKTVTSSAVNRQAIRAIFTLRLRRWPDGTPIRVFVLPDRHAAHQRFTKKILGVFPHQLRTAWDRQIFSGIGQAPTTVTDESDMLRQVAATAGAIGYLSTWPTDNRVQAISLD